MQQQAQGFSVEDYLKAKAAGGAKVFKSYGGVFYTKRYFTPDGDARPAMVALDQKEIEANLAAAQQQVATLQALLVDMGNAPEVIDPLVAQS